MMFCRKLLLFGLFSTAVADFFRDHLKAHINRSIDPCVDFYSHVCPPDLDRAEAGITGLAANVRMIYKQYFANQSEETEYVIDSITNNANQLKQNVNVAEDSFNRACSNDTSSFVCVEAGKIYGMATQHLSTYEDEALPIQQIYILLSSLETYANVLSTSNGKRALKMLNIIRSSVNENLRKMLKNTAWILKHEDALNKWIKQVDDINTYIPVERVKEVVDQAKSAIAEYRQCMERDEAKSFEHFFDCLPTFFRNSSYSEILDFQFVSVPNVNADSASSIHQIRFRFPGLMALSSDNPFAMVPIVYLVGHETGHQFIREVDTTEVDSPARTNETTCVVRTKDWICDTRHKGERCHEGSGTFKEDFADLVGAQLLNSVVDELFAVLDIDMDAKNIDFPWMNNGQRIFYDWSSFWCEPRSSEEEGGTHSRDRDRIYFMMSQNAEFRKAFNCPDASPMFNPDIGICHVFGEEAPAYKQKKTMRLNN